VRLVALREKSVQSYFERESPPRGLSDGRERFEANHGVYAARKTDQRHDEQAGQRHGRTASSPSPEVDVTRQTVGDAFVPLLGEWPEVCARS
jgi:hypothetical protein